MTVQVTSDDHLGAPPRFARHRKDVAAAAHDRQPASAFGKDAGKLRSGSCALEADAVVLDRCNDAIARGAALHVYRAVAASMLDGVRERLAERRQELIEIHIVDAVSPRKFRDSFPDDPSEPWFRLYFQFKDRVGY